MSTEKDAISEKIFIPRVDSSIPKDLMWGTGTQYTYKKFWCNVRAVAPSVWILLPVLVECNVFFISLKKQFLWKFRKFKRDWFLFQVQYVCTLKAYRFDRGTSASNKSSTNFKEITLWCSMMHSKYCVWISMALLVKLVCASNRLACKFKLIYSHMKIK